MTLDRHWKVFGILLASTLLVPIGCDNTDQKLQSGITGSTPTGKLASTSVPAAALIEQVIQSYQNLKSYEDTGRVRLLYALDGQLMEDIAPLAIALERPNRLGIKAYRVQAGPTADRWRMRVSEGTDAPLPHQVVSRNLPEAVELSWLSSDAIAGQYLAAGLAGFPPQLDLLLSPNPMRGLVDDSAMVSSGGVESIGDIQCHIVNVVRGGAEYRLWIDQTTNLLRRLEMPQANLPPTMLEDQRVRDIKLTIELDGVKINQPIDWSKWQVPAVDGEQLVSHFVMPPPPLPTSALGKQIPAFLLSSAEGREILKSDSRTSASQRVTVLLWLADHPACRVSAAQVADVARQLAKNLRDQVQFVAVWAEPNPPADATFADLEKAWNLPMPVAVDRHAIGRDLFGIREAPTLVVLDSHNRLQIQEERGNPMLATMLPGILQRLVAGENLAERIVNDARSDQERFLAELWMAAAVDANVRTFNQPGSYPPRMVKLNQLARIESTSEILSLASDDNQLVWLLRNGGSLERLDSQGKTEKQFQPKWKYSAHDQVRMEVAPNGQFIAACARAAAQVNLLDISNEEVRTVQLTPGQRVTDLGWVRSADLEGPQLAILTSDRRTLLVDPDNGQQLSGECPAEPLAVVPQSSGSGSTASQIVLADRRVEPVVWMDSGATKNLVRPASHAGSQDQAIATGQSSQRLQFQPGSGPWSICTDPLGQKSSPLSSAILARGWFAANEPAIYMLDSHLAQQWHYRMPLTRGDEAWPMATVANDPVSGQPLFFVVGPSHTVHLLRADGQVSDHFQLDQPIRGIASLASGDHLQLLIAHPHHLVRYRINTSPPLSQPASK